MWLFGLLDLPFYVILPQMGLRHWIFIGGSQFEPLIGARMMGMPDPLFYMFVVFTTLGLGFLYLKPLLKKGNGKTLSLALVNSMMALGRPASYMLPPFLLPIEVLAL